MHTVDIRKTGRVWSVVINGTSYGCRSTARAARQLGQQVLDQLRRPGQLRQIATSARSL